MSVLQSYKKNVDEMCVDLNTIEKRKMALMCLERQYKVYESFAQKRNWDRRKEYREILDECWKSILYGIELKEELWEKHERIKPEVANSSQEEYASMEFAYGNIFACNIEEFLETLLDDKQGEEGFLLLNLEYLINYMDECGIKNDMDNDLINNEMRNQKIDLSKQKQINSFEDVIDWRKEAKSLID